MPSSRPKQVSLQFIRLIRVLVERGTAGGYPLDLARHIKVSSATVGKILERLERDGLVKRWQPIVKQAVGPQRNYARLTAKGRRYAERLLTELDGPPS